MADIIKLLPDSVANQIAAGEVIQRPASAVKELIENAIDAGADSIKLIIKDAGRTLIQVIDNGSGMSETDARLSFERHATSKINEAKDLFSIRTMGFRGEALASVCAIAHVELKTKRKNDDLGTCIINEGSLVKSQEPCSCESGTSIAVKNLFYNVPARRNFLKAEQIELKHITEEFLKLALANPHIVFSYFNNNSEMFHLEKNNLKKRIMACFGNSYNDKLVALEHTSDLLSFTGFISKPDFAKKTRGEQYFFTNKRFMRHNYLNHAVFSAYNDLIKKDSFPSFFIFIDIDPEQIDVNIHPTKTEIKFQDEKMIYSFLNASIKKALGIHNVMPSIDFSKDKDFDVTPLPKDTFVEAPVIKVNPDYNPFKNNNYNNASYNDQLTKSNKKNWQKLYEEISQNTDDTPEVIGTFKHNENNNSILTTDWNSDEENITGVRMMQLHNRFILSTVKSGIMLIDQQAAHERILYEKYLKLLENKKSVSQQLLFPQKIELSPYDAGLVLELKSEFNTLGFDIRIEDKHEVVVNGAPIELDNENLQYVFEKMLENYKSNLIGLQFGKNENIAASLSKNISTKKVKALHFEEMNDIIEKLFACSNPYYTPYGKATVTIIKIEELENFLKISRIN